MSGVSTAWWMIHACLRQHLFIFFLLAVWGGALSWVLQHRSTCSELAIPTPSGSLFWCRGSSVVVCADREAAVRDNDRHYFCHSLLDLPSLSHKGAAGSAYSLLCSSRWIAIAWAPSSSSSSSSQHLLNDFAKFLVTLVVIHIKKCPQTFVETGVEMRKIRTKLHCA